MLFIIKNIEVGNPLVEKYYSEFFYLFISEKLRFMTAYIPSDMGYGSKAQGNTIPANSDLEFIIELIDISN